jgi:hypothetical protein
VKPFTRRLVIPLTSEIKTVRLLDSPFGSESILNLAVIASGGSANSYQTDHVKCSLSDKILEIMLPPDHLIDFATVKGVPLGLWPVARRLLAEGRDRAKPMLAFATPGNKSYS